MRRAVAAVVAVVAVLLLLPVPADAQTVALPCVPVPGAGCVPGTGEGPGDAPCRTAPDPQAPENAPGAFFFTDVVDPGGDPFGSGPASIYQRYGWAGLRWDTYDLGCGPSPVRDAPAVMFTEIANLGLQATVMWCGLLAGLLSIAYSPGRYLGFLDRPVVSVSAALQAHVYLTFSLLVLIILGLVILMRVSKGNVIRAGQAAAWAVIVGAAVTALAAHPLAVAHAADAMTVDTVASVTSAINGGEGTPAESVSSNLDKSILYKVWLIGEFGSADSETAKKYGPMIFDATTLTFTQQQQIHTFPDHAKTIIAGKKAAYTKAAAAIAASDPDAYANMQGKHATTRVLVAVIAAAGITLCIPFLLVSALILIAALLIIRIAVAAAPAVGVIALLPSSSSMVMTFGKTVLAGLINAVLFSAGSGFLIVTIGAVTDDTNRVPWWLQLILVFLVSLVMWKILKPFRSLTSLSGIANPFREPLWGDARGAWRTGNRWNNKANSWGAKIAPYLPTLAAAAVVGHAERHERDRDRRRYEGDGTYRRVFSGVGEPTRAGPTVRVSSGRADTPTGPLPPSVRNHATLPAPERPALPSAPARDGGDPLVATPGAEPPPMPGPAPVRAGTDGVYVIWTPDGDIVEEGHGRG